MEEFNLQKHTIEEIIGNYIIVNGVTYTFRHKIKEGGNYWIFLLEHTQSHLCQFVCKIFKIDDSQRKYYEQATRPIVDNAFRLNLETNSNFILHTEIYEANGSIFKFQEYFGSHPPVEVEASQEVLLKQAVAHENNQEFQEAISIYEQLIAINPYDTYALLNLANTYWSCYLRTDNELSENN